MKKGFVYILKTLDSGRFYIGSTTDINRRLHQHKMGRVRATRQLQPIKLELSQEYGNIHLARKVEYRLKRFKRKDFIEKIIKDGLIKVGP
jgi:putative endonuclease